MVNNIGTLIIHEKHLVRHIIFKIRNKMKKPGYTVLWLKKSIGDLRIRRETKLSLGTDDRINYIENSV